MPEEDGEKIYNTSFVFDRSGNQIVRHRKMHLFDIRVDGGQSFCESDTFSAGEDITVFDTEFGKMGLIICFDIRFPELTRLEAFKGAQAVFVPAAFNMTTGPAHWELSFRARALDNQVFMVGCAPARDENAFYVSYANSIVTGPWGDVLARAGRRGRNALCRAEPKGNSECPAPAPPAFRTEDGYLYIKRGIKFGWFFAAAGKTAFCIEKYSKKSILSFTTGSDGAKIISV